ncbi:MAG: vitamin K epoxide reductase family protein [Euryarchaeota archaeon]|jgi:uncharacterized membrane protein|nr:vitamin K epoxide reductase family protein [Euryarchaeota archaeon]MBT4981654.1 vitamin K epoxide reductase family protein [Euryarchaeota archaeon]MBT5183853.1 vitamin K epoxide reductase family protein [Euryarchaeota archaeon]
MALDANTQLMFHWIPIVFGMFLMSPLGEGLAMNLSSKWPSLSTTRGRTLGGILSVALGGFTVSAHTLWIHNKANEMGGASFCSADGIWDCSSVIGNSDWNTMPFIGLPWGIVGMLAFALFMWLIISVAKEPTASWVLMHLKVGTNLGILGIGMIFYLIYAEYDIGKLCQYCTTAHVAHVVSTFGFFRLGSMYGSSAWGIGASSDENSSSRDRKSKRGGYVAPKLASEEE